MISKATGWQQDAVHERGNKVNSAMKAVINWAALEEHDSVLDLSCGDGVLLREIGKYIRLYSCGLCSDPEQARAVRESLDDADVVYGTSEDIPWKDDAFDVVISSEIMRKAKLDVSLKEINRVLRPGGQFVILTRLAERKRDVYAGKTELMRCMQMNGFESVSWRVSGFHGVAVGWKRKTE